MGARAKRWWIGAGSLVLLVGVGHAVGDQSDVDATAISVSPSGAVTTETPTITTTAAGSVPVETSPASTSDITAPASGTAPSSAPPSGGGAAALRQLSALPIKGRAPMTRYDRALFGAAWSDDVTVEGGHNGCDTRNDMLRRDLSAIVVKPGTNGCVVSTGTLADPYTGRTVGFTRGSGTSSQVQIDHVVALADAWQTGAQQLSAQQRQELANDPRNLQATIGSVNQQKSASDAASWLPPAKSYRCTYVARQVAVKVAYHLWVTPAEHDAIARVLGSCDSAVAATKAARPPPTRTATPTPTRAPTATQAPTAPLGLVGSGSAYYKNCAAARAAGVAPLHRDDPGYRPGLDRDDDGIACE